MLDTPLLAPLFWSALLHGQTDLIWCKTPQGRYLTCNRAAAEWFGREIEQITGCDDFALFPFPVAEGLREQDELALAAAAPLQQEERLVFPDGRVRDMEITRTPIRDAQGELQGLLVVAKDVSRLKRLEKSLMETESKLHRAQAVAHIGSWYLDMESSVLEWSAETYRMFGIPPGTEVTYALYMQCVHPDDREKVITAWRAAMSGERYDIEHRIVANGEVRWVREQADLHFDAENRALSGVGTVQDITLMKESQHRLEVLAYYDSLTQLPNRVLLTERLRQALDRSRQGSTLLAVACLDLDKFQPVNELYGSDVGDSILVEVAHRLEAVLRPGDTVARLGGDEFVILLNDLVCPQHLPPLMQRILAAVAAPYLVTPVPIELTASMGVTLFPNDNEDSDRLLRHADQSMLTAKQGGGNRYQLFDTDLSLLANTLLEGRKRIRQALEQDEFRLYFQPKVDVDAGRVIGVEALIRWQHPEDGLLTPARFLPFIEEDDLIIDLGWWVIQAALQQVRDWRQAGLELSVGVNLSVRHMQRPEFTEALRGILSNYSDLPAGVLELEILETTAFTDLTHAKQVIEECQTFGVHFALDDFGTGYSSLTYLRHFPAQTLKIDQSFVRNMQDNEGDRAIIQGTLSMARSLGMNVVAEGVETLNLCRLLHSLGCHQVQGYAIAHPMPAEQISGWVAGFEREPIRYDAM